MGGENFHTLYAANSSQSTLQNPCIPVLSSSPPQSLTHLSSSVPNRLSPFSPTNAVRDLSETYNVKYRKYHQSRKNIANISPIGESSACQPSLDFLSPRTSIRSFVTLPPISPSPLFAFFPPPSSLTPFSSPSRFGHSRPPRHPQPQPT